MSESLKLSYQNIKSNTRIPVWTFIGVALIAVGIVALTINENQKAEKVTRFITAPRRNDVFQIKLKDDEFTLYKVAKVDRDTVYFFANQYTTNQETGLDGLAIKPFDESTTYGISIPKLRQMNKDDKIIDVDRY